MAFARTWARVIGALIIVAGVINLILAPILGDAVAANLWGVEPLTYVGAILVIAGLGLTTISYVVPHLLATRSTAHATDEDDLQRWSQITQQYFELFDHDLGRPLRRILGKERESRAVLQSSGAAIDTPVQELLDEIERQTPNFRLMMSNIRVLVQLEAPDEPARPQPVEPSEVVRRIVDRYASSGADSPRQITWWAEPAEFGIVHSDSSVIEHIVTNLVDNAVRFATSQVEVKITKNPSHFFIRVWDDGTGIAPQYLQHIFDRGWTPEVARREERSSS
ncbi:MAG: sensor histidine kinase, partial [Dehalococcoidia bacterium]